MHKAISVIKKKREREKESTTTSCHQSETGDVAADEPDTMSFLFEYRGEARGSRLMRHVFSFCISRSWPHPLDPEICKPLVKALPEEPVPHCPEEQKSMPPTERLDLRRLLQFLLLF